MLGVYLTKTVREEGQMLINVGTEYNKYMTL